MSTFVEWNKLAEVVVVSVVVGAGVPAVFALGVRALAGPGSRDDAGRRSPVRVVAGVACFAVVVSAIAIAIWVMSHRAH